MTAEAKDLGGAAEWLRSPEVLQERRRRGLDGPGQAGHA